MSKKYIIIIIESIKKNKRIIVFDKIILYIYIYISPDVCAYAVLKH